MNFTTLRILGVTAGIFQLLGCSDAAPSVASQPSGSGGTGGAQTLGGSGTASGASPGGSSGAAGAPAAAGNTTIAAAGSGGMVPVLDMDPCKMPRKAGPTVNVALNKAYVAGSITFSDPTKAVDGSTSTDSGSANNKDGALALDFGAELSLGRTVLTFPMETPQRYKIQGSSDAVSWTDILRVHNPNYVDERLLPSAKYRYLRFVFYQNAARGEDPNVLNPISEIEVYESGPTDPIGCQLKYPAVLDRSAWQAATNNGQGVQGAVASPQQGWMDPHGDFDGPEHWLTKMGLFVGTYVSVDMASAQQFDQIFLSADHVAPQDYSISVSDDGTSWAAPIASGSLVPTGGYDFAAINFPLQTKRYFKIESKYDSHGKYAGLWNLVALNSGSGTPEAVDSVNIALNKAMGSSANAVDGNAATFTSDAEPIVLDFGQSVPIAQLKLTFGPPVNGFTYWTDTSEDGQTWIPRQGIQISTLFPHPYDNVVRANYTTRFLRFRFQLMNNGQADVPGQIREIEVYRPGDQSPIGRGQR